MNQKVVIESLSMDLLRVALGLHRGSIEMAERFKAEALKRQNELDLSDSYLKKLVLKSNKTLHSNVERVAEDALMYSILFRNYASKLLK